jgi:hypothetical protein
LLSLAYERSAEIEPSVARLRFEQGLVVLPPARAEEMHDTVPWGMEELCDQTPVATPPESRST